MNEQIQSCWTTVTLGDVLVHRQERARPADPLLSVTSDRGVLPQAESGRRDISSTNKWAYWRVYPGDIVYNTMRMWQGVSARSDYYGIVSPAYTVCCPRSGVDGRYLSYALKHPMLIAAFKARSQGLVSDTWNLKYRSFAEISIPIPCYADQQRIAKMLDAVSEAIRRTSRLVTKLERAKQGLIHDLLTRGVESWDVVSIGDIGEVLLGRQRSPQHQKGRFLVPYLRVANVFDGFIDYSDVLSMNFAPQEQEIYGLRSGDILLNEGQSLELVGRCAIYEGRPNLHCFQNTLVRYRCSESLLPKFAYLTFKHWLTIGRFMQVAKKTTSMAHLGATRFAAMRIAVPPLAQQRTIVAAVDSLERLLAFERDQLTKRELIRKGLMDDLLTGRVLVPSNE